MKIFMNKITGRQCVIVRVVSDDVQVQYVATKYLCWYYAYDFKRLFTEID
jgi:hypothetical protein